MLSISRNLLNSRKTIISTIGKTSQCRVLPALNNQTVLHRSIHYSNVSLNTKKQEPSAKDTPPPSSILNDDLLMKAGFDVDATLKDAKQQQEFKNNDAESSEAGEGSKEGSSSSSSGGNGNRKRRKRVSSTDLKREKMSNMFYVVLLGTSLGLGLYMGREWENAELQSKYKSEYLKVPETGYSPDLIYKRAKLRIDVFLQSLNEPPFDELLPPPPPPPYQRPLTLVIALEDLLIHSEWTSQGGWKTKKRPGVDFFLGYLSQYYEIVLFSNNSMMYGEPIIQKIDPINAFIAYSLYKEHCVYRDGDYVKDLSKLNRDLGKVIALDCKENEVKLQKENLIPLEPWTGANDDTLLQLIPFLEYIVTQNINDVRPVLNSFKDKKNLPVEFNERVDKLREKFYKDNASKQQAGVMRLLGVATGSTSHAKFPLDFIREEGLNNYNRFMKLVEEEKEKIEFKQKRMKQTFTLDQYLTGQLTQEEMMKQQMAKDKELEEEFAKMKSEKKNSQQ